MKLKIFDICENNSFENLESDKGGFFFQTDVLKAQKNKNKKKHEKILAFFLNTVCLLFLTNV